MHRAGLARAVGLMAAGLMAAGAAWAADPMDANSFERYTQGRTIYYSQLGQPFGVEEYLPGNRVRWSFLDGQCKEGFWYQEERFICFVYDDQPDPQCWTFFDEGPQLRALYEDTPGQTELFEIPDADEPMLCLGPDVGV